jgi:SAM-dependent methyltransferase
MKASCRRRPDCRLCGSDDLADALKLTPTPLANAFVSQSDLGAVDPVYPLEVALCRACGHAQLRHVVDPGALFENYLYVSGTSPAFVRHFEDYANDLARRYRPRPGALVVDVGSNDGTLLRFFKALGYRVLGIDPAKAIAKEATEAGIETLPAFLTEELAQRIAGERGRCALVTANNVFAHVDDLAGFLRAIRALLAPDGLFAFEVSYLADVYEKCLFDTIYHEHLDYHTVAPLVAFFARESMQLVHVGRVPTHGGSIRGIAQLDGGARPVERSIAELTSLEARLGLRREATFAEFSRRIEAVKLELASLLGRLKSEGARIAGFGAPAKATTLMYHLGLGPGIIDFIVDDSPYKQGLYTPGMHIPVLPASEISARKPGVLVVLAWNFADSIIAKNQAFLRDGGRFVVPLPEVRLIAGA